MTNYYNPCAVYPVIPSKDISDIELSILRCAFSHDEVKNENGEPSFYFYSEDGISDYADINSIDLFKEYKDIIEKKSKNESYTVDNFEQKILNYVESLGDSWIKFMEENSAIENKIDSDLFKFDTQLSFYEQDEIYISAFQRIIARSADINYVRIEGASTCDRMRPGSHGGFAIFITKDDVQSMSTASFLDQCEDEMASDATAAQQGDDNEPDLTLS